jgi:hypothetical protein
MYDGQLAYPLRWLDVYPRTSHENREEGKFMVNFAVARDEMVRELKLLGASNIEITSCIPLNSYGIMLLTNKPPEDPGVGVYFQYGGENYGLCCDRWLKAEHNLRAIGLHLGAIRGMERWGVSGGIAQAFVGYKLPT